jgi:hypothetical protein
MKPPKVYKSITLAIIMIFTPISSTQCDHFAEALEHVIVPGLVATSYIAGIYAICVIGKRIHDRLTGVPVIRENSKKHQYTSHPFIATGAAAPACSGMYHNNNGEPPKGFDSFTFHFNMLATIATIAVLLKLIEISIAKYQDDPQNGPVDPKIS